MDALSALAFLGGLPGAFVRQLPDGRFQAFVDAGHEPDPVIGQFLAEHPIGYATNSWVEAVESAKRLRDGRR